MRRKKETTKYFNNKLFQYTTKCCALPLPIHERARESARSAHRKLWNETQPPTKCIVWLVFVLHHALFFVVYLSSSADAAATAAAALFSFGSVVHYIVVVVIIVFVCSFVIFSNYLCSSSESWILCVQQTWTFMHNKLKMSRQNMLLKNTWKYTHQTQSPDYNTMHILLLGFFFSFVCGGKRSKKNCIFSTQSLSPSRLLVHFSSLLDIRACRRLLPSASLQHITWFVSSSSSSFVALSTQTIWFRICIFRMHFNALVSDLIIKFVQRNGIFEKINEPEISISWCDV